MTEEVLTTRGDGPGAWRLILDRSRDPWMLGIRAGQDLDRNMTGGYPVPDPLAIAPVVFELDSVTPTRYVLYGVADSRADRIVYGETGIVEPVIRDARIPDGLVAFAREFNNRSVLPDWVEVFESDQAIGRAPVVPPLAPALRETCLDSFTDDGVSWDVLLEERDDMSVLAVRHLGGGGSFGPVPRPIDQVASLAMHGGGWSRGILGNPDLEHWRIVVEIKAPLVSAFLETGGARTDLPHWTKIGDSIFVTHVFRGTHPTEAKVVVTLEGDRAPIVLDVPALPPRAPRSAN